jgi:hypothetical protein
LPRLTVLSWSKRELAAFVNAVEQLGHYVHDLAELVDRLKAKTPPRKTLAVAEKVGPNVTANGAVSGRPGEGVPSC